MKKRLASILLSSTLLFLTASCGSNLSAQITFHDGDNVLGTLEGASGTKIADNADLKGKLDGFETKEGYSFRGWHQKSDFSDSSISVYYIPYINLDLYGNFLKKVTVTLKAGDGAFASGAKTTYSGIEGDQFESSFPTPTKANATFASWHYTDTSGADTVYDSKVFPSDDLTLTAVYSNWPTLSFVTNVPGYAIDPAIIEPGTAVPASLIDSTKLESRADYKFVGWYTDTAFTKVFDFTSMPSADTTIYAEFLQKQQITFTSLVSGFDDSSLTISAFPGDPIEAPDINPAVFFQDKKYFAGWYRDPADLTSKYSFVEMPSSSLALTAVWTSDPLISLYSDFNGTTAVFSTVDDKEPEGTIDLAGSIPTYDSDEYSFEGWYTLDESSNKVYLADQANYKVTEDPISIYAYFKPKFVLSVSYADAYGNPLTAAITDEADIHASQGDTAATYNDVYTKVAAYLDASYAAYSVTGTDPGYKIRAFVTALYTTKQMPVIYFPYEISAPTTIYALLAKKISFKCQYTKEGETVLSDIASLSGYQKDDITVNPVSQGTDGYYYVYGNKTDKLISKYDFNYAYDITDAAKTQFELPTVMPKENITLALTFIAKEP
jgi:uncharacterized repeat protein (TIGR02543 family)